MPKFKDLLNNQNINTLKNLREEVLWSDIKTSQINEYACIKMNKFNQRS